MRTSCTNETSNRTSHRSVADTVYRIGLLCPDRQALVSSLTLQRCEALLSDLRQRPTKFDRPFAVDSLKNVLAETKTFANWCVPKKWLRANPFGGLRIEGKRRHRKPQLRLDEARRWTERAMTLAESGDAGAVAALVTLTMGLRASEVVKRTVRDLDSDGTVLVVEDAKTEAGNRRVRVPVAMQPFLKRLANGRSPADRLFGNHWRDWVRKAVARLCKDAGVPVVCAHSMRGLHSTLAMELGISPEVVAKTLGHESVRTTLTSYAAPDAVSVGLQRRATANLLKNTKRRPARRNIVPVSFRNDLFAVRRGS
jgi:integrase